MAQPTASAQRLGQLCVALTLTVPDFARLTNYTDTQIARILDGRARVTPKLQAKVLDQFPAVNPHWLLAGEGPMFRVTPHVPTPPHGNQLAANYGNSIQIINAAPPAPCRCCCTINLLQDHLREKERVIQLLLQQLPSQPLLN